MTPTTTITPPGQRPELLAHRARVRELMATIVRCKGGAEATPYVRDLAAERQAGEQLWGRVQREAVAEAVALRESARRRGLKALRPLESAAADLEQVARSGVIGPRVADLVVQLRAALEKR